ncbi:GNAT family N-acetyltransferase [Cellulomonas fimi]|uniref:GNAT family N-acetyltransferase n=1 Tax=Cellulomonas fimi TaxID=1708 RepID=UPI00234D5CBA|nr:GNAT family N-acetyltransferase [Cellulomonas fimi]MDC7122023.1 GNAT family N-acetyltransferase [Cellulomonas fimi]
MRASASACVLVAEHDGRVVGLAVAHEHVALNADGPVVWLEEIVVDEAVRRGGVGRALVASVEAWAQAQGARHVALATRRAIAFYRALGYTETAPYVRKQLGGMAG